LTAWPDATAAPHPIRAGEQLRGERQIAVSEFPFGRFNFLLG